MTYATQQNMVDRFGETELKQLTDRVDASDIDATVLGKALADADAKINGYVSTRYSLPLSPVPADLERIACDIARYFLYEDRVTDQVKQRYDDAIAWLKDVARGTVSIGVDSGGTAPAGVESVQFPESQKVFAREDVD